MGEAHRLLESRDLVFRASREDWRRISMKQKHKVPRLRGSFTT